MSERRSLRVGEQGLAPVGTAVALTVLAGGTTALGQSLESLTEALEGVAQPEAVADQAQPERGAEIRDPLSGAKPIDESAVRRDANDLFELHVQDEDLANVLRLLSIQSERNIIASKNVSATVTADLYGVTFYEALDAILNVNNYAYIERGNFIEIYTREEVQKMEEAQRKVVSAVVFLNYLNALDAAEFVKPLLSEFGEIKATGEAGEFALGDVPPGNEKYASGAMMVVYDFEENVEAIRAMLKEIDTKPSQVLVEATILQTSLNEANEFGIDFTVLGSLNIGDFVSLNPVDALAKGAGSRIVGDSPTTVPVPGDDYGTALRSNVANFDGPATLKVGLVAGDFSVFLKALDQVADTTILSRPKILTLNRQPARVLVGRKVGYLSTTSTDTATTQTVEFLDTGTQLNIRPFVSNEGMIRMELKPAVSEAVIRSSTDATGAAVTIPDEITNELTANVMVRDGQTIVLGGLFREATSSGRRQVPWLGDLPIVGAAFRGHEDSIERSEIIFMITPTVVNDNILIEQAERGMSYVEHARAGAREGLLPFSREKRASQLLIQARNQAREGKRTAALHSVQRSLALSPAQQDAIALREKLLEEPTQWPERSILHEVIRGEAQQILDSLDSTPPAQARRVPAVTTEEASTGVDGAGCLPPVEAVLAQGEAPVEEVSVSASPAEPVEGGAPEVEAEPVEVVAEQAEPVNEIESPVEESQAVAEVVEPSVPQASAAPAASPVEATSGVTFVSMESVDVHVQDAPIAEVLRELARAAKVNLIANKDVTGNVTADLYGVSFHEALDALTSVNGYGYIERGRFIEVYPSSVIEQVVRQMSGKAPSGEETEVAAASPEAGNAAPEAGEVAEPSPEAAVATAPEAAGEPIDLTKLLLEGRKPAAKGEGQGGETVVQQTKHTQPSPSQSPVETVPVEAQTASVASNAQKVPDGSRVDFASMLAQGVDDGRTLGALFELVLAEAVWDSPVPAVSLRLDPRWGQKSGAVEAIEPMSGPTGR